MNWTAILAWLANEITTNPNLTTFATDLITFILSLIGGDTGKVTPAWLASKVADFKTHRGIK